MPDFWPWPFPVSTAGYAGTITTVNRSLPERLSDVVNVKDWGATGNGSTEDSGFIQNAIDFCIWCGGGTVFFPPGRYHCFAAGLMIGTNDPAQKTNGVQLIGSGGGAFDSTNIDSQSAPPGWWVFSKGTRTYDLIHRVEGFGLFGTGGIKVTGSGVTIKSVVFYNPLIAVDASEANGCSITDCGGQGGDPHGDDASGNTFGGAPLVPPKAFSDTGVGIYLGNNCVVSNCRLGGNIFITYALSGTGAAIMGGVSTETTTIACRVGWKPANPNVIGGGMEAPAYACTVTGLQTERQVVSLDIYNATGCLVTGNILTGGHGPDNDQNITNLHWSGGTVTGTTIATHNLPVGDSWILLSANAGLAWNPTGTTTTLVTRATPTTFTYTLAANPGADTTGSWSYSPKYCIRVRKAHECVFSANDCRLNAVLGTVDLNYDGEAVHSNNLFLGLAGQNGWVPPVGPNAAGWNFINCGSSGVLLSHVKNSPSGNLTFDNLPGQFSQIFDTDGKPLLQGGPYEGQEFTINNGSRFGFTPPTAASWGDQVITGGNGKYKVRWDGSVWRRIG